MGVRGELFSTKVALLNRTYFFNVKENRLGDLYLNIVESKNRESGGFDRQSVILFADDLPEFLQGFEESLRVLDKANREKHRNTLPRRDREKKGQEGEAPGEPGRQRGKKVILKRDGAGAKTRTGKGEGPRERSSKGRPVRAVRRKDKGE
ncbi:MAG: DUF3276 family protein [Treponema sp.]|jgi:hypothetical protein|nr:DUF3276 family protein [Treponema sp.]